MGSNEVFQRSSDPRSLGSRRGAITLSVFLLAVVMASLIAFGAARPAETQSGSYSTVVDNAQQNRFTASRAWRESAAHGNQKHGPSFAFARKAKAGPANFRVKIPTAGEYKFFARWPAARANSESARIGVRTASGMKWKAVNQRKDGGRWVRIGIHGMAAGDEYSVFVSHSGEKSNGRVVADAVKVVEAPAQTSGGAVRHPDSILGKPIYSQAEVADYARSAGSTKYIMKAIPHYYKLAPKVGIAPDFLVAQSMLETGYGRYGGDSRPWNMAGIKKGGDVGDEPRDFERPATARAGVRMHINHMAAYTNRKTIGTPHDRYYDARAAQSSRGYWVSRISQLGNGVWATDPNYAPKIRSILDDMG